MATSHPTPTPPEMKPEAVAKYIGREYCMAPALPSEDSSQVVEVYRSLAQKIDRLFEDIPVPVIFTQEDPYDNYEHMAQSVAREQELEIYAGHADDHPIFSGEENLKFRAVHDWYGHLAADVDFSPTGEYNKWVHMTKHFNEAENRVLFSEVIGQVGAVHWCRDNFADPKFEQRAFMAPEHWLLWMSEAVN